MVAATRAKRVLAVLVAVALVTSGVALAAGPPAKSQGTATSTPSEGNGNGGSDSNSNNGGSDSNSNNGGSDSNSNNGGADGSSNADGQSSGSSDSAGDSGRSDSAGDSGRSDSAGDSGADGQRGASDRAGGDNRGRNDQRGNGAPPNGTGASGDGAGEGDGPPGTESGPPDRARGGENALDRGARDLSTVPANAETARATVRDAESGRPVSVDIGTVASDRAGVRGLELTPTRDGSFDVGVAVSDAPPSDAPAFEDGEAGVPAGARRLSHVRVTHSIADANISSATFTLAVEKSQLRSYNAGPEQLTLFRYHGGEWNAVETDLVRETEDAYVLRARSPGLSDFAVGLQRPSFRVQWTNVTDAGVRGEADAVVRLRIRNTGGADGVHRVELSVDGTVAETKQVTVISGGTRQVTFRLPLGPGVHRLAVNGEEIGVVGRPVRTDGADGADAGGADRLAASQSVPLGGVEFGGLLVSMTMLVATFASWRRLF